MRPTRTWIVAVVILVAPVMLAGAATAPGTITRRPGDPDVFTTPERDADMKAARTRARETIADLVARLTTPPASQTFVAVKAAFDAGDALEHVWQKDVHYRNGRFTGTVNNVPIEVRGIELGDRVTVPVDQVSDWMAIDGGRLIAGYYAIRVYRSRLSPEERQTFDKDFGAQVD